jgi:hypothetical protein
MRALRRNQRLSIYYHYQMAKLETLKMEHTFMKIQNYWSTNKRPRGIGWSNESCTNVKSYQNVQLNIYKLPNIYSSTRQDSMHGRMHSHIMFYQNLSPMLC